MNNSRDPSNTRQSAVSVTSDNLVFRNPIVGDENCSQDGTDFWSSSVGGSDIPETVNGPTSNIGGRGSAVLGSGIRVASGTRTQAVIGKSDNRTSAISGSDYAGMPLSTLVFTGSTQQGFGYSPFGFQQPNFPVFSDGYRLSAPQQQGPTPSQYGMMGQWVHPWSFNPMAASMGWCPLPPQGVNAPVQHQPMVSSSAMITSQPSGMVVQSQPTSSSSVTLSVPSRRGRAGSRGAASAVVRTSEGSVPSSYSSNTANELRESQSEPLSDSDRELSDVSDEESSTLGNEADSFREAVDDGHELVEDGDQDTPTDVQEQKDRKIFSKDRVDPILLSAAQLAGAEYLDSTESKSTLLFGQSGLKRSRPSPILFMPPDVYEFRDDARSYKGAVGKTNALTTIFRVPEEDYRELFKVPDMGSDVESFLKGYASTQSSYVKAWENSLKNIDQELRSLSRLSSFQLLIANAMAIQLSDSPDAKVKEADGDADEVIGANS